MAETRQISPAMHAALFAVIGFLLILMPLMPFDIDAEKTAFPDLLLPFAVAWSVRRPDTAPLAIVAALLLLSDLALNRPVGLWAMICLLMVEAMRAQREAFRNRPFPAELAGFALVLAIGMIAQALALTLALVPQPRLGLTIQLYFGTLLAYPVIVAVLHWVLRIRSPRPQERSRRLGRVA